jgi:hypothetical protein
MSRLRRDEGGAALITVLLLSTLSVIAVTSAVSYSTNSLPRTRAHEDWNAALAAAEAGVEDVAARLVEHPAFYLYPDPDNEALTGWRSVPGSDGGASYHYRVDNAEVSRTGTLEVTATGRVGESERTVRTALRRRGFLDFIYFTDLEKVDPFTLFNLTDTQRVQREQDCAHHQPAGSGDWRAVANGACAIVFAAHDVVDGPMHTNDAFLVLTGTGNLPRFLGPVTTAWAGFGSGPQYYIRYSGSGAPYFAEGLRRGEYLQVPSTGDEIRTAAREEGCVYVGPTYIRLMTVGGAPKMYVRNTTTPSSTIAAGCEPNTLLDVPTGSAIFVENGGGAATHPLNMNRGGSVITGTGSNSVETETEFAKVYGPTAGDVFVHGELEGQLTIAAENDVVVVHDLTYVGGHDPNGTNMLGLVAEKRVSVSHPVSRTRSRECDSASSGVCTRWKSWSSWTGYANATAVGRTLPPFNTIPSSYNSSLPSTATTWRDPRVDAAILALNRSFHVQEHGIGAQLGTLHVYGAIAQKWRGPVATGSSTGYLKNYVYDWRLRNISPPHFPVPEGSRWGPRNWAELSNPRPCTAEEQPPAVSCLPT